MRSPAFRLTIGAAAWVALGVAAFLLVRSEQRIKSLADRARGFDQQARAAANAFGDVRMAQQAYVAAGQGLEFWMPRATASMERADAALADLRSAAAGAASLAAIEQAAESSKELARVDQRVREYLKTGQQLMAADVVFTEATQTAAAAMLQVEAARQAEAQGTDSAVAAMRKQQAIALGAAAGVAGLIVLVLVVAPKPKAETAAASLSIAPERPSTPALPAGHASSGPTSGELFKAAATLATDFGRVRDLDDLTRLLGRAAELMDASGVMVWMAAPATADLRPVLAHGYSAELVSRIPAMPRTADNAAAKAFRSGSLQIVLSRPGASTGAVVAPILSPSGCIGALSAEIRHGAETSETTQALATMFAAHLATVVAQTEAEAEPARAVSQ